MLIGACYPPEDATDPKQMFDWPLRTKSKKIPALRIQSVQGGMLGNRSIGHGMPCP